MHGDERVADIGEFGLIRRIARILSGDDGSTHFGDDTAILDQPGNNFLLATTDMLVDGVHFHRSSADPFDLGRRAVSINVSDIASMGGTPTFGLTSLALPPELPVEFVEQLYRGMHFEADRFGLQIVGGNTTRIVDLVVV
ncbi:MAG TPA: thiamine-phosphate kinase, partial [Chloroflexota bacterium]